MKSLLGPRWKPPKPKRGAVQVLCRWRHQTTGPPPPPPPNLPSKLPLKFGGRFFDPRSLRQGLQLETSTQRRPLAILRNHEILEKLAESRFNHVVKAMGDWATSRDEWHSFGLTSQPQLEREIGLFRTVLAKAFSLALDESKTARHENPLFWNLRNAFIRGDSGGLDRELRYAFQTFLMRSRFPKAVSDLHAGLADLRFPYEWYPATRMMQRTIHLHVGPTNSGKTYNALKALENARTGIYAGPLRLLAHEIWNRFTVKNKPCALITGEEMRIPTDTDTWFHSCTVEMTPLNANVDVAVIDEIQMIASEDRGWAWTQAFLGVQAKEVHLCGEERVVPLIKDLCARIGEECVVHTYQRLNPLETMAKSLKGDFKKLQKGDAVVAFSRVNIHQLKAGIEKQTGRRCAIVYGNLPPETRASQAALFNDPNNEYDFLAASDAIGMGLNLEIKRVVFETSSKFDGLGFRPLTVPEIKQIGGRAGRYRTAAQEASGDTTKPSPGLVTALDDEDLGPIKRAFQTETPAITTAGLFPPPSVIERFHSFFPPRTPISFVLARLREMSRLSPRFHMCDFTTAMDIAEIIKPYDLSIADRCVFLNAPINLRDSRQIDALRAFAQCVAELGSGHLLDFPVLDLEVLELERPTAHSAQAEYLHRLESLHMAITLYLWLSYRYQGVFQSQHLAFKVKEMVQGKIADHLEKLNFVPSQQRFRRKRARQLAAQMEEKERDLMGLDEEMPGPHDEGVGQWEQEGHEEPMFDGDEDADAGTVSAPEPKRQAADGVGA